MEMVQVQMRRPRTQPAVEARRACRTPVGLSRRAFLRALGGLGALTPVAAPVLFGPRLAWAGDGEPGRFGLDDFAANIKSGGPPKDGIPSIDDPKFTRDPGFLSGDDVVFGIARNGDARAYPQLVVVWHEIVNDEFDDGPVSITYCPLTGSVVAFRGTAPNGVPYTFGTSGRLVNSNLLMYDRQTDSRWPQIVGQAIKGRSKGRGLEEIALEWTTWDRWRRAFPDSRVLTTETGHLRDYGSDPYGNYDPNATGYYSGSDLLFPVMRRSRRFGPKEVFIGAKHREDRVAVRKRLLRERKVVTTRLASEPVVFLYDPDLREGRAFLASTSSGELQLSPTDIPGEYADSVTGAVWDSFGRATADSAAGGAAALSRIVSLDVMWFAWFAFFPDTKIVA